MVTPAGSTAARRAATVALMEASSHLFMFRQTIRRQVLAGCGVPDGYTVSDAAFVLGLTTDNFNAITWQGEAWEADSF